MAAGGKEQIMLLHYHLGIHYKDNEDLKSELNINE